MSTAIAGDRLVNTSDPLEIGHILATIRQMESHGNYTALNQTASASGAYQYIDSTWRTKSKNVAGATSYPRAYQAPATIQDAVAAADVRAILAATGDHLAAVPVYWYAPSAWNNDRLLDTVPAPGAGNKLTVRQYAESWIKQYDQYVIGKDVPAGSGSQVPGAGLPIVGGVISAVGETVAGAAGGVWGVVSGFADAASSPLELMKAVFAALTAPETWVRVLKVVGGLIAIGMGLWIITHDQPLQAGMNLGKKAATVAAVA